MKTGLLERILTRRYGPPLTCIRDGMAARCWNIEEPTDEALLYVGMTWQGERSLRFASLKDIYGDALGGILINNCLKAAIFAPRRLFAVWNIYDLRMQPEVQHALARDPAIEYFMEAFNVYFYGLRGGDLYVFDAETDELDRLGPVEPALETLMDEFEAVRRDLPRP